MLATQEHRTNVTLLHGVRPEYTLVNKASMFIDLVNSTSWHVAQNDIDAFESLRACLNRMSDYVHAYGGNIVKFLGDGVHAAFEQPADALFSAVAFQNAMSSASVGSKDKLPNARVSLSFGTCVRYVMCGREDYYGHLVILASRLAQQGEGGDIVMSEDFRLDNDVDSVLAPVHIKAEARSIKGFSDPIKVYRLDAAELPLIIADEHTLGCVEETSCVAEGRS